MIMYQESEQTCTVCCRVQQPKQKSPRGFSLFQCPVFIGDSESVEKNILQQPPLTLIPMAQLPTYSLWGVVVMSLLVMMCSNFLNLFLRKSHSSVAKLWFANLQVPGSIPVAVNFSIFFKYYFNYVYLTVLISYKYGRPLFENGRVKAFTTGEK